jgi:hypothetical protein
MAGYGQNMMDIRNQSSDLWTQMLKQAQGLQSGQANPWDLPEFKQYQELFQNMIDKMGKNLYANATAKGINPGAMMNQLGEQGIKGLNQGMMDLFTKAYSRIPQYAAQGNDMWNKFAQLWLQKNQQDMQQQAMSQANTKGWVNSAVGAFTGLLGGLGGWGGGNGGQPNIDWSQAYGMNNGYVPMDANKFTPTWGYN